MVDEFELPAQRLTDSERRLIALIGEGLDNKQIAERCGWTNGTAKVKLSNLYCKTGLSRHKLAVIAIRQQIVRNREVFPK